MRLIFKQRFFSWYDSYDVYDEFGNTVFTVQGQFAWGKKLQINDALGSPVGVVQQKVFSFMPTFELYRGENYVGSIRKEFTFFRPAFHIDCNGWWIEGDWMEWDYAIYEPSGSLAATVSKEFGWTDQYVIDVADGVDAVVALMVVIAIDGEKDNRD